MVPGGGMGYGLLRYLGGEGAGEELGRQGESDLSFNYMGQLDTAVGGETGWGWAGEGTGEAHGGGGRRSHLIDVNAWVVGGRLEVEWTYSREVHREGTVEDLARGYMGRLRSLIAHCVSPEAGGYTPSDFPQAHLTQKELDELIARFGDSAGLVAE